MDSNSIANIYTFIPNTQVLVFQCWNIQPCSSCLLVLKIGVSHENRTSNIHHNTASEAVGNVLILSYLRSQRLNLQWQTLERSNQGFYYTAFTPHFAGPHGESTYDTNLDIKALLPNPLDLKPFY